MNLELESVVPVWSHVCNYTSKSLRNLLVYILPANTQCPKWLVAVPKSCYLEVLDLISHHDNK